ncbi:MAG: hypothetical protein KAT56_01990 [Sedimentisphaerales bacterium]|nr:hypothetical protein [Sedimentisphaerales bacterium]
MNRFASNPIDRHQVSVFRPTLEETIGPDHPVQLYNEILAQCQWSSWENQYFRAAGQPPIHPRIRASITLYGLGRGIRSSRVLEYMCCNSIDYIWLVWKNVMLWSICLNGKKLPRTVCREQHEELREAMDERMATPAGKALYRRRNWIAETPFAIIKAIMNLCNTIL